MTAHVPDIEFHVFVSNSLNVEADGRNCGDVLIQLEFVENSYAPLLASAAAQGHLR